TAIEERGTAIRVFFATAAERDAACAALVTYATSGSDIPDDNWAARSQQSLTPITIGRIRVIPRPELRNAVTADDVSPAETLEIVIEPAMGFGTGHHATTRLCLMALQSRDLRGVTVLDAGAGSGILAIAAAGLGAAAVHGIDYDVDAVETALANRAL